LPESEIAKIGESAIATSVIRVRQGRVHVEGGYDGVFGKIHIYSDEERASVFKKPRQIDLF
jgi:DNA helicase II / ATP-dependent DNA helicase PcrA